MVELWQGTKRVAFIPVSNGQVDANVPPDFQEQVYRRAFIDPDPASNVDRSLKAYIHHVSSGKASLTGHVFPPVVAPDEDVIRPGLESLPSIDLFFYDIPIHGFDLAVLVLPHSAGAHRGGFAWYPGDTVNGVSYYCRVALFDSPTLLNPQKIGVWAMEVLHMICRFGDLYYSNPPLNRYDVMSCACGTHPTAYTKDQFGWLDSNALTTHSLGSAADYALSAVSYPQPVAPGRNVAIRVKSQIDSSYFMIEARDKSDVYENVSAVSAGIGAEGVVIYQVRDTTDVELRQCGLTQGMNYQNPQEDLTVRVEEAIPGGYRVNVHSRATVSCRELRAKADALQQSLDLEQDLTMRKQLISALVKIQAEMNRLHCQFIADPGEVAWNEAVHGRLIGSRLDELSDPQGHSRPEGA